MKRKTSACFRGVSPLPTFANARGLKNANISNFLTLAGVLKYPKKCLEDLTTFFMSTWWGNSKNMKEIERFILKICQTVSGLSMINEFHEFFLFNLWLEIYLIRLGSLSLMDGNTLAQWSLCSCLAFFGSWWKDSPVSLYLTSQPG